MPYYRPPIAGAVPESFVEAALAKTLGIAPALLPVFSAPGPATGPSWAQSPYLFLALALVYGFLHWHSRAIDGNIRRLSEAGWWHVKRPPGPKPDVSRVGPFERIARTLRGSGRLGDPSGQHPLGRADRGSSVRAVCAGNDGVSRHHPSRNGRRRCVHDVVAGERQCRAELA